MKDTFNKLDQLNQTINTTEQKLAILYEQRREIINYLGLNKGIKDDTYSISRRGHIEPIYYQSIERD